ncbi:Neutral endopeptidase [Corynebacterium occultum]|uniref:Neutral endopeptidase n=1 Tax=Corynebacterium occultum TaxID=2675219 RepID=A0A6B8VT09_9CORY|nr:M13-type metalloendopeptidase [Corynebacterium occultum]QGU06179.1 Neutral endopeptidase [Corynebacterium occultum]
MNDLYHYVNGPWLAEHVIPEDRGVDGTFHQLRDDAEADVHAIVKEDGGRAGTLFKSFMDTEAINAAGLAPLDADLDRLAVSDIQGFLQVLGELDREGVGAPVGFWVEKDSAGESGDTAVAYLIQSGLGLPDEAYYREAAHAETLATYREHVASMLTFLGSDRLQGMDPDTAAARILALETEIAAGHWDVVSSRDAVKTYNPTTLGELPRALQIMLEAAGLPEGRVVNMMPSAAEHIAHLLVEERLADWQLWATWHILSSRAGLLPEEVGERNFGFYGTRLSGATQQKDRWKRGVALTERLVGHEIGKIYVERHFPASSKANMLELVSYLTEAYRERITNLAWMTPETRERALAKLDKFQAKIGYPEQWRSYEGLEVAAGGSQLLANVRKATAFLHDYELNKIGEPADRDEWFATPQTVNAFYNPVVNDITFPAAILRAPFYSPDTEAAENFGAIGAVIGHEIGHGFDDQGSQYDGDGNLNSWWSDADRAAFTELTDQLVAQFNGLVPSVLKQTGVETAGVNGSFTLGENIGDLGGLGIAVVAYRRYLADQGLTFETSPVQKFEAEGADPKLGEREFNGIQRLFLAWARVWRTAIRPELATQYLAIDPHSPAEFRCNQIAANIAEFYEAFPEITPESEMYLAPEQRVTIW